MTTTTYPVTGMTCEHCVNAVTSELGSLHGVSGVTVDLEPGGISRVTVASDGTAARPRGQGRPSTRRAAT